MRVALCPKRTQMAFAFQFTVLQQLDKRHRWIRNEYRRKKKGASVVASRGDDCRGAKVCADSATRASPTRKKRKKEKKEEVEIPVVLLND